MIKCPNCGSQWNSSEKFCGNCGAEIIPDSKFCTQCGNPLN